MPKVKRRLAKKKAVRRVVRRAPQTKQPLQPTPEQKAKDVEMMKAMLMARPAAQIAAGVDKQQDQLLAKLDMLNKRYDDQVKAGTNLKAQIQQKESLIQQIQAENAQMKEVTRQKEERNKLEEKHLKEKEREEERQKELDEKHEELRAKRRKYDRRTKEGKHKEAIAEIDKQLREMENENEDLVTALESNADYMKLQEERAKVKELEAQNEALQEKIDSSDFKNSRSSYIQAKADAMVEQFKQDNLKEVLKQQMELANIQADVEAQKMFIKTINAPREKPLMDENGIVKGMFGFVEYETNQHGTVETHSDYTMVQRYRDELATQIRAKYDAEAQKIETQEEIDAYNNLVASVAKGRLEAAQEAANIKARKGFVESKAHEKHLKKLQDEKARLAIEQRKRELQETSLETRMKVKNQQAENDAIKKFAPEDVAISQVMTQIQVLGDTGVEAITKQNKDENERNRLLGELDAAYERIEARYSDETKGIARYNLDDMILNDFLQGQRGDDVHKFDNQDLATAVEFIKMVENENKNVLLNNEECERFEQSMSFQQFFWPNFIPDD